MVITAPMMAIGGVMLALSQDASLAWVLIAVIPVVALVFLLIMRRAIPLFQPMQVKLDRLNLVLDEGLTGVRVIRAFDRGAHEHRRFDAANLDVTDTAIAVNRLVALLMPAMILMLNLTSIAIIWFGSLRIDAGAMQVGAMIASLQYAMQILFAVFMVTAMFVMLPRAVGVGREDQRSAGRRAGDQRSGGARAAGASTGHVEFENVTFQYPGAEEPALSGVSFAAQAGRGDGDHRRHRLGQIDAGRSHPAVLRRQRRAASSWTASTSAICAQRELRARIGFVPQKAVLFSGTIAENIRYGREHASDEDLRAGGHRCAGGRIHRRACRMASSPSVAQGGTNLSGGQKQRLSIARALVRRPEIYIFDDSFSALDFATDARLRAALKQDTVDATVFIVSQRIGTVMDADRIIVLDNGRVAGIGTHAELLESNEVYREIVESQASLEEVA